MWLRLSTILNNIFINSRSLIQYILVTHPYTCARRRACTQHTPLEHLLLSIVLNLSNLNRKIKHSFKTGLIIDSTTISCKTILLNMLKLTPYPIPQRDYAHVRQLAHSRAHKAFQRLFRKLPALPGKQMNAKSCGELKVRTMALRITSSQPERRKRKNSNKKNKRRRRSRPPSGSSSKRSKPTTSSTASVDL